MTLPTFSSRFTPTVLLPLNAKVEQNNFSSCVSLHVTQPLKLLLFYPISVTLILFFRRLPRSKSDNRNEEIPFSFGLSCKSHFQTCSKFGERLSGLGTQEEGRGCYALLRHPPALILRPSPSIPLLCHLNFLIQWARAPLGGLCDPSSQCPLGRRPVRWSP